MFRKCFIDNSNKSCGIYQMSNLMTWVGGT